VIKPELGSIDHAYALK